MVEEEEGEEEEARTQQLVSRPSSNVSERLLWNSFSFWSLLPTLDESVGDPSKLRFAIGAGDVEELGNSTSRSVEIGLVE